MSPQITQALKQYKRITRTNSPTVRDYPQVIKYMGSKAKIISFVVDGLETIYNGGPICDVFAGACALAGALGHRYQIITNDIQQYSTTIAHCYLSPSGDIEAATIIGEAEKLVRRRMRRFGEAFVYPLDPTLREFQKIEARNRSLIDERFSFHNHLFLRCYSGTWWSAEQCAWIDAIREISDELLNERHIDYGQHQIILTALMHAMAYSGQGTGHYAQYRDSSTVKSMKDINTYRQKSVANIFSRKLTKLVDWNNEFVIPDGHQFKSEDYRECLGQLPKCTIYADPPYAFVHYSRFYHAIETLVKYDFPRLQVERGKIVKGRYRENRHQSPFSIRSQVEGAFLELFHGVAYSKSNLALSYSNTGLIALPKLIKLARDSFGRNYSIWIENQEHTHMTMGRRQDRDREVNEALILVKRR